MGRNALYKEWFETDKLTLLMGWARDGLSNEQIAKKMGITSKTLFEWRRNFPVINNALKKGKEIADYEVENALFKRACGYDYVEVKTIIKGDKIETTTTTKHIPPDPLSIFYYLKNKRPDKWRDKVQFDDGSDNYEDLTPLADAIKLKDEDFKLMEEEKMIRYAEDKHD